jgi:hypothetical protein
VLSSRARRSSATGLVRGEPDARLCGPRPQRRWAPAKPEPAQVPRGASSTAALLAQRRPTPERVEASRRFKEAGAETEAKERESVPEPGPRTEEIDDPARERTEPERV